MNDSGSNNLTFYLKVVGVTYDNRQSIIKNLRTGDRLKFRAETNNVYDAYAVSVLTSDGRSIGFIDKEHNQTIHKNLKAGQEYKVEVANVTGGGYGMNYGVNIKVEIKSAPTAPIQKPTYRSDTSIVQKRDENYYKPTPKSEEPKLSPEAQKKHNPKDIKELFITLLICVLVAVVSTTLVVLGCKIDNLGWLAGLCALPSFFSILGAVGIIWQILEKIF